MKFEKKTVYIYEINGKEKIKISSDEEAKKWDGIFDMAAELDKMMQKKDSGVKLSDSDRSDLCIFLARYRDDVLKALDANPNAATDSSQNDKPKQDDKIDVPEPSIPASKDGFSL